MSSVSPPSQSEERTSLQKAVDWNIKHRARIATAHEGMMIEKILRQNRIAEIDARNTMTNKPDDTEGWPDMEDTDMSVKIGDEVHNHYHQQSIQQENPVAEKPIEKPTELPVAEKIEDVGKTLWQKMQPWLIGAGLVGGPLAGFLTSWALQNPSETPQFKDTDTHIGVDAEVFGPEEG